jgi:hypothetical protein
MNYKNILLNENIILFTQFSYALFEMLTLNTFSNFTYFAGTICPILKFFSLIHNMQTHIQSTVVSTIFNVDRNDLDEFKKNFLFLLTLPKTAAST